MDTQGKASPKSAVRPTPSHAEAHLPAPFEDQLARALADDRLQRNLLTFQRSWRESRDQAWAQYEDSPLAPSLETAATANPLAHIAERPGAGQFVSLRDQMAAVKDNVITHLDHYVARFTEVASASGVHVHFARTAAEANQYILDLCARHGIQHVVKSKTMVSEETNLNAALEQEGIAVVETDLGEWIVQLAHERPSHMVMPAIHKSRQQVGALFTEATGAAVSGEDITEQVGIARRVLRRDFLEAGLGVSGANALIAESGTVMFICNEGNARLVTSLPRVHVVLAGIEKLVPDYAAAMLQLRLLARSATAQSTTSYTTFVSGPADPGKEMHIVLVDNGRTAMRDDPLIKDALRCIRCAACANVCPPYAVVGGHVFGYVYSGAIGLVNTPFHHSLDADAGPQSLCVSCNACATVCPVGIPLPQQILSVRNRVVEHKGLGILPRFLMSLWSQPHVADLALRIAARTSWPFVDGAFLRVERTGAQLLPKVRALTSWRTTPALALRPARDRLTTLSLGSAPGQLSPQSGPRVAYFIQCVTDRLYPEMAEAVVAVLRACGAQIVVPADQHCCGLLAFDSGDRVRARRMARQTIQVLEQMEADYIVTAGTSCAITMLHDYEALFAGEPRWKSRAAALARKVMDFTTFVDTIGGLASRQIDWTRPSIGPVTYHNFCQSTNILGISSAPRRIIESVLGLEFRELPEASVCCGFGGSTSAIRPEVSRQILARKLDNIASTGASVVVTDNPGCIMHLRGGLDALGSSTRVLHIAELIAMCLPAVQ